MRVGSNYDDMGKPVPKGQGGRSVVDERESERRSRERNGVAKTGHVQFHKQWLSLRQSTSWSYRELKADGCAHRPLKQLGVWDLDQPLACCTVAPVVNGRDLP